jgi:coenzyme F420-reducing hydrogenase delta subunit
LIKKKRKMNENRKDFKPKVIAFACHWCGVGKNEINAVEDFPDFKLIKLMCSGRINTALILKAFERGADGVIAFGCPEGKCHYNFGSRHAAREYEIARSLIGLLGIEPERLKLELDFFSENGRLDRVINDFVEGIRKAGPSPLWASNETDVR